MRVIKQKVVGVSGKEHGDVPWRVGGNLGGGGWRRLCVLGEAEGRLRKPSEGCV